ncbi:ADP-ribose pyrophosphatase YjhB, NUDIX family [Micromonospora sediminicola]|uniref:ADP-ribose pyrophosphatase YjhB, NUDIX family n=1 Tax=Micromonospora sediminicola TaxID=946078 RepID=A0A1A9B778_9ACTN|nr:NUDIX domain-containing protein [Micromonospora sediminicola]SBT65370.1 ADP-ribose pyrophosphatase YjhB, NUDIX family [Micromonospora sediminicola]
MSALTWAVAAVVSDGSGRVLLCRRSGGVPRWGLPGGRLRHDENPPDAAVRSIRAETGWLVDLVDLVGLYRVADPSAPVPPAGRCGPAPDVLVHVFRARPTGGAPAGESAPGCHPEWHPSDALPRALTPATRAALVDALAGRSGVLRNTPAADPPPPDAHPSDGVGTPPGQRSPGGFDTGRR